MIKPTKRSNKTKEKEIEKKTMWLNYFLFCFVLLRNRQTNLNYFFCLKLKNKNKTTRIYVSLHNTAVIAFGFSCLAVFFVSGCGGIGLNKIRLLSLSGGDDTRLLDCGATRRCSYDGRWCC